MYNRLCLAVALAILCVSTGANAQQKPIRVTPPAGWESGVQDAFEFVSSPDGNVTVAIAQQAQPDFAASEAEALRIFNTSLAKNCGTAARADNAVSRQIGGVRVAGSGGILDCSLYSAQYKGHQVAIMTMAASGRGAEAEGVVANMLKAPLASPAAPPPARAAAATRPPASSGAVNQSVESSGKTGIWVAIALVTVYDPVMAVRLQHDTVYLVLTPGGYFMTYLPEEGGFTDASAKRMMAEQPDGAGTFTMAGNAITLNFADGTVKTGKRSGDSFEIDGDSYNPKRFFPDGMMLKGRFSSSRVTQYAAGGFVTGESLLVFSPEGRFAVTNETAISDADFSVIGGPRSNQGSYFIKDSALHLNFDNGEKKVMSMWQEKPNDVIWFDGEMHDFE